MLLPALVFIGVTALVLCAYLAATSMSSVLADRRLAKRLRDVGQFAEVIDGAGLVMQEAAGPLPALDGYLKRSSAGSGLARLIEQSGIRTTPSAMLLISLLLGTAVAVGAFLAVRHPLAPIVAGLVGAVLPFAWLAQRRSARFRKFEEQFPEALDLLSRAIRAGHAFQSAMGMVGDELPEPAGPEFKKTFERQNFGLPLRDAMDEMADRLAILDVRFFVTAVAIQRETGGNLSEILDNLAHVVRERFKIRRQVRVHTAHGRFTGYVLLALPAALGAALSFISPDHMKMLFQERMGQTMLVAAMVMQTVGFLWIRQVIKIEV
jgi:tight adherence protein B